MISYYMMAAPNLTKGSGIAFKNTVSKHSKIDLITILLCLFPPRLQPDDVSDDFKTPAKSRKEQEKIAKS